MSAARSAAARPGIISRLIAWWLGHMTAMMPSMDRFSRPSAIAEIEGDAVVIRRSARRRAAVIARLPLSPDGGESAAPRRGARRPVTLRLGPREVIRRELSLPSAVQRHLGSALRLQAEMETPYRAEDCLIGSRIIAGDADHLRVDFVVAPRSRIASVIDLLARGGYAVQRIETTTPHGIMAVEQDAAAAKGGRRRDWISILLLLVCLGLGATALYIPWQERAREQARLQEAIAKLEPEAMRAEAAMRTLDALDRDREGLEALSGQPLAVAAIDSIAAALPDGAWLEELRIDGDRVRLIGFAPNAAGLPADLARSETLDDISFEAPVTLAPGAQVERFDIGLTLAGADP